MFEEEIRKILDDEPIKMYPSIEDARRAIRKRHKELAHQICQLEPKPEYDASITQLPDPFEPKADEGKDLEMSKKVWKFFLKAHADECDTDAVVDLTVSEIASIKDAECQKKLDEKDKYWISELSAIDRDANDVKDFTRRVCDLIVQWQAKLRL